MKVKITETELITLIEKVIAGNGLNEDKEWIQKAYASGDVKDDKLTKWCDGNVTCECVERALKNKGMKKGAQMYLNMNKSKCKSLKESIIMEQLNVLGQQLPPGVTKGSQEHRDWINSQKGGDKDEILENLLIESQRLTKFIENVRDGKSTVAELSSIQENINNNIKEYLAV